MTRQKSLVQMPVRSRAVVSATAIKTEVRAVKTAPTVMPRVPERAIDPSDIFYFVSDIRNIIEVLEESLRDTPAVSAAVYPRKPYSRGKYNKGEDFGIVVITRGTGSYTERVYDFNPLLMSLAEKHEWYPPIHVYTESEANAAGGIDELAKAESPAFWQIYL